jgi:hypothetical protein
LADPRFKWRHSRWVKSLRWHNLWRWTILQFLGMLRKDIPEDLPVQPLVLTTILWAPGNHTENIRMIVRYENP